MPQHFGVMNSSNLTARLQLGAGVADVHVPVPSYNAVIVRCTLNKTSTDLLNKTSIKFHAVKCKKE